MHIFRLPLHWTLAWSITDTETSSEPSIRLCHPVTDSAFDRTSVVRANAQPFAAAPRVGSWRSVIRATMLPIEAASTEVHPRKGATAAGRPSLGSTVRDGRGPLWVVMLRSESTHADAASCEERSFDPRNGARDHCHRVEREQPPSPISQVDPPLVMSAGRTEGLSVATMAVLHCHDRISGSVLLHGRSAALATLVAAGSPSWRVLPPSRACVSLAFLAVAV